MERVRVVLDAMGTDRAPGPEVEAALILARESPEIDLILVGQEELIRRAFRERHEVVRCEIVHAPERVTMEDKPAEALKTKPESSIAVGMRLVKEGKADAFVSAGNTGAVMAFALRVLGRLKGIHRPAIAAVFPSLAGPVLVLDVGANTDPRPRHLVEFAVMGEIFARYILNKPDPRVAFLSIGEEDVKGNERVKEARPMLERIEHLQFVGNIEGNHILQGRADVVVTDGFTGNVLLKFGESVVSVLKEKLKNRIRRNPLALTGALLLKPALEGLKKEMDYEEYGGAPLLGVQGVVIIAHGRSGGGAMANAVRVAARFAREKLNEKILADLEKTRKEERR